MDLERARSMAVICKTPNPLTRVRSQSLNRSFSAPNFANSKELYMQDGYRSRELFRYSKGSRDWDMYDDYWCDRMHYTSPLYWPTYKYSGRRYSYNTPPYSLDHYYPGTWYQPRYKWSVLDYMDGTKWRRYRDPYSDRPTWFPYKKWTFESRDIKEAVSMYKKGLVDFASLDRHWLSPYYFDKYRSDMSKVYIPTGFYGPRRYTYSFL